MTSGSGAAFGSGHDTDTFVRVGIGVDVCSGTDTVANPVVVAAAEDCVDNVGTGFRAATCTVAVAVADASIASVAVGRAGTLIGP
jgi:hypothetical protein